MMPLVSHTVLRLGEIKVCAEGVFAPPQTHQKGN